MATYFVQWSVPCGHWLVWCGSPRRGIPVSGFRGASLSHILSWCGDRAVTILPSSATIPT